METIDKEFELFFDQCGKEYDLNRAEITAICRPLIWRKNAKRLKLCAIVVSVFVAAWLSYGMCDTFAWSVSALGRLVLIQLLPLWNWTPLYNAKCLIERQTVQNSGSFGIARLSRYETEAANCLLCETLERIPTASNTTYSFLDSNYLERGLPVIITDSHEPQTLATLLAAVHQPDSRDFVASDPCDVATNLMLRKIFSLDVALQKIKDLEGSEAKWFLQLRNCKFDAVKASRLFVTRPYFYPRHLEPFYSSWLLLANNYALSPPRELYVQGLIFVQQLSGQFEWQLRPKQPCDDNCPVVKIRLEAGECLVFSSDLWLLRYGILEEENNTAMATILEIDWQL